MLPVDRAPSFDLSDSTNRGNPHFYFLPPMVSAPRYAGTFDPALSPVVEICRGTANPVRGGGRRRAVHQDDRAGLGDDPVDAAGQLYVVNCKVARNIPRLSLRTRRLHRVFAYVVEVSDSSSIT